MKDNAEIYADTDRINNIAVNITGMILSEIWTRAVWK